MGPALRVAWYRLRTGKRRPWTGLLSLVLLVGLVGGLAMASIAGSRRTESSFPTYEASTNPSTLGFISRYVIPQLGIRTGYDPRLARSLARLPLVTRAASMMIFDANIDIPSIRGVHPHPRAGESPPTFLGSLDGEFTSMDRVTLLRGRRADSRRVDEAVMNAQAARLMGVHVGSVIRIPFYSDASLLSSGSAQPALVASVRLVGVFEASRDVIESDLDSLKAAAVIFSPALTRELALHSSTGTETYLQIRGGASNAKRVLKEVYRVDPVVARFGAQITAQATPQIQSTITPEAVALGVFGAIAALATLLVAGLVIARIVSARSGEVEVLRSLGAPRAMMAADYLVGPVAACVLGAVLAVAVAVALSPLAPLGPVRPVYPTPGVALDATVLGFGFLVLVIVLSGVAFALARRDLRAIVGPRGWRAPTREPRWVHTGAVSALPISLVAGVRFATGSGRTRNAAPVRSALAGSVLAVTVLMTTVTFGASLNGLVARPSLYGWNWDDAIISAFSGAEDLPGPQIAKMLDADRDVASWSGANEAAGKVDGERADVLVEPVGSHVAPPLLSGHGVQAVNQVVLGGATLASLHKTLGQTVTFDNGTGRTRVLTIVGTMTVPAFGNGGMGDGALVAPGVFPAASLNLQDSTIPGPNVVLVRVRAGVSRVAAYRSLIRIVHRVNAIPASDGSAGGVITLLRPIEIVNFRSMGTTPTVFAALLAGGALMALGLTVSASVRRRRRDLALLKALGLTRRQLAATIAWQSTVAAVVGVVVGVPLGAVVGRALWVAFARSINAVPSPVVPTVATALIVVGGVAFANLVSALPGRRAARTPVALVLRAE